MAIGGFWGPGGTITVDDGGVIEAPNGRVVTYSASREIEPGHPEWDELAIDALGPVPPEHAARVKELQMGEIQRGYTPVPFRREGE